MNKDKTKIKLLLAYIIFSVLVLIAMYDSLIRMYSIGIIIYICILYFSTNIIIPSVIVRLITISIECESKLYRKVKFS